MSLTEIAEFCSSEFMPFLPDDSQVNPQVYGAELAYWLSRKLAQRGVVSSYPEHEDWGWYIEYTTANELEFAVHCCNIDGANDRWLLALRRRPKKLFGRATPALSEADPLLQAVRAILSETPSITNLKWLLDSSVG